MLGGRKRWASIACCRRVPERHLSSELLEKGRYKIMKGLFWLGLVLLVLGIAWRFVAIPQRERHGIEAGGASIGVEVKHDEKLPPWASGLLIAGGVVMMIAGGRQRAA